MQMIDAPEHWHDNLPSAAAPCIAGALLDLFPVGPHSWAWKEGCARTPHVVTVAAADTLPWCSVEVFLMIVVGTANLLW